MRKLLDVGFVLFFFWSLFGPSIKVRSPCLLLLSRRQVPTTIGYKCGISMAVFKEAIVLFAMLLIQFLDLLPSTDLSSVNVWICLNVFISYNNCQCLSTFYTFFLRWTLNRLIFLLSLWSLEQRKERYVTLEGRKLGRSLDIAYLLY